MHIDVYAAFFYFFLLLFIIIVVPAVYIGAYTVDFAVASIGTNNGLIFVYLQRC